MSYGLGMTDPFPHPLQVLLIDDDEDIQELICVFVREAGLTIMSAASLADAALIVASRAPEIILLDLNLPDGDGMDYCAALRHDGYDGAIIMLTARLAESDRVKGLEGGADDYMSKPFSARELVARLRIHLRHLEQRRAGSRREPRIARFGKWRLDLVRRRLIADDESVVIISTAEFDLLRRLILSPGVALSREELVPERRETVYFDRSFDNRLSRLRAKLSEPSDSASVILTVRNRGYVIATEIEYE